MGEGRCFLPLRSSFNTHEHSSSFCHSPQTSLEISGIQRKWEVNTTTFTFNQPHKTTLSPPNAVRSPVLIDRSSVKWLRSLLASKCVFVTHNCVEIKLKMNCRTNWWKYFLLFCQNVPLDFPSGAKQHGEVKGHRNVNKWMLTRTYKSNWLCPQSLIVKSSTDVRIIF